MNLEYLTIAVLLLIIFAQFLRGLKDGYKIAYYETRLELDGVRIDHIRNKTIWSMMTE